MHANVAVNEPYAKPPLRMIMRRFWLSPARPVQNRDMEKPRCASCRLAEAMTVMQRGLRKVGAPSEMSQAER